MPDVISLARARALFRYDAATGMLYRRHALCEKTGKAKANGYLVVGVDHRTYQAHRLIWFITQGRWPAGEIDHVNGDKGDNRLANLRDVTHGVNARNRADCKRVRVIGPVRDGAAWKVVLPHYETVRELGPFTTPTEADEAYRAEAAQALKYEGKPEPRLWLNGRRV